MNVKRIWSLSIVFGLLAATVAYFVIFNHNPSSKVSSETKVEAAEEKMKNKAGTEAIPERDMQNPMLEVTEGKRAISLKAALAEGVSGYVQPDSKVDVIAFETTIDEATKKKYKSAVLVLENIKVLTSGKASDNQEEALHYETVTIEVTPEEGVMLSLASKDKDGFYFMLRNAEDSETGKVNYKQTREVIEGEAAQ